MDRYDAEQVEAKWQPVWEAERAFHVDNPPPDTPRNPRKRYVLEQLPYPSGSLHMGHMLVYTLGDVRAHFYRRTGHEVMRPMGFDSFGLPAENAAIKGGGHPRETTERNVVAIRRFMKRVGWAIDWDRELSTHDPSYYRWTQWLFLRFYEAGLAYRKAAPVKWCPNDQTVLANEQVHDGHCDRCGAVVESRNLEQWFFKTTAYADELLHFEGLRWSERVVAMQRNWIGRSEGADVLFRIEELDVDLPVFTTRPDTLYGATYFVVAPEHPIVERLAEGSPHEQEIRDYVRLTAAKSVEERVEAKEKTGVFTGRFATNPDDEVLVDSAQFSALSSPDAKRAIVEWLESRGRARPATSYRLRDWGFSRQRYWGCPIPIVHCGECGAVPVPDEDLPVLLPDIEDYLPKGKPPLASNEEWMRVPCPRCGREARREAETMDTFVDSSWYFLRYCDPHNDRAPFAREIVDYWGPVDFYQGGVDHATMHMIYARFFQKALNDLGLAGFREPFAHFHGNGWVKYAGAKMSKSRRNVIAPDEVVARYGADPVRLYMLFVGPADQDIEWTEEGIEGMVRFVRRLWRLVNETAAASPRAGEPGGLTRKAHETIAKGTHDIGRPGSFNTAIAAVMELANELAADTSAADARFAAETAVSLIQPYAPHVAEELWERLGRERLWAEPWPVPDPAWLERATFELVIQGNGRVRDRVQVSTDASEEELVARAKESPKVRAHLDGKEIRQAIVVPRKLVNLVVG